MRLCTITDESSILEPDVHESRIEHRIGKVLVRRTAIAGAGQALRGRVW
jgi:hypothetical protein